MIKDGGRGDAHNKQVAHGIDDRQPTRTRRPPVPARRDVLHLKLPLYRLGELCDDVYTRFREQSLLELGQGVDDAVDMGGLVADRRHAEAICMFGTLASSFTTTGFAESSMSVACFSSDRRFVDRSDLLHHSKPFRVVWGRRKVSPSLKRRSCMLVRAAGSRRRPPGINSG